MRWKLVVNDLGQPIEGYEVSESGDVRSYWTMGPDSKVGAKARDKTPLIDKRGCWSVNLRVDHNRSSRFQVHRLVALAFLGPPPTPDSVVVHKNHNDKDNRAMNLRWVDKVQAFAHSAEVVDRYTGAQGGAPRLTQTALNEIRDSDLSQQALARKYGVNVRTIYSARTGRSWKRPDQRRRTGNPCKPAKPAQSGKKSRSPTL